MRGHIATGSLLICGAYLIFKWLFCQYKDESIVMRQLKNKEGKENHKEKETDNERRGKYESQKKT